MVKIKIPNSDPIIAINTHEATPNGLNSDGEAP